METENTLPVETTVEVTEPLTLAPYEATEPPAETVESTTAATVAVIDYTPVIQDSTNVLANIILCGALMIVGVLLAFKLWEVPHK